MVAKLSQSRPILPSFNLLHTSPAALFVFFGGEGREEGEGNRYRDTTTGDAASGRR